MFAMETFDYGCAQQSCNLGLLYFRLGAFGEACTFLDRALRISNQFGMIADRIFLLGNQALVFHHLGDTGAALASSRQALAVAADVDSSRLYAYTLTSHGRALVGLDRLDEALEAYQQAADIWNELGKFSLCMEPLAGIVRISLEPNHIKKTFLENVPVHREIISEYQNLQSEKSFKN